mmetsp:Transcript_5999/g.13323  ORF Transcript_5999/g.13323 Transcript_5999/m.13323 type:complete len:252 (+) Transcript_5999:43-798(+)
MLLVSILLYRIYTMIAGSMAIRVLIGFLLLSLANLIVRYTGMRLMSVFLGKFMEVGALVAIVLFQQEIKKFLFWIGNTTAWSSSTLAKYFFRGKKATKASVDITPVVEAVKALAGSNTEALIVFSTEDDLQLYKETGDLLDAVVSKRLLMAIFSKQSPLHDGGVIICKGKIVTARSIFPVTERRDLPPQFGARHRAAIGITEVTNTLALIVSEETGQISVARNGTLENNLSIQESRTIIHAHLQGQRNALM